MSDQVIAPPAEKTTAAADSPPAAPAELAPFLERGGREIQPRDRQRTVDLYAKKLNLPGPAALPTEAQIQAVRARALDARAELGWAGGRKLEELNPALREALEIWQGSYEWYWEAKKANVPLGFWRADLTVSEQTPAVKAARRFCLMDEEDGEEAPNYRAFVALGGVGVGKTYAQVGAMRELLASARDRQFVGFRQFCRALINPGTRAETLEEAIDVDLLLLDDVGGYIKVDGLCDALVEEVLLERELDRRKYTLISSNFPAREFYDVVGDRVADRLLGGWGLVSEIRGASLRRRPRPSA